MRPKSRSGARSRPPVAGQAEVVADMGGVALHHGEERLLPARQAPAVLAADHRLVADIIGDVVEIDACSPASAPASAAPGYAGRSMKPIARVGAPEIRRDLARSSMRVAPTSTHGTDGFRRAARTDARAGAVMLHMPDHHRRRVALVRVRNTAVPGTRGTLLSAMLGHELGDRHRRASCMRVDHGRRAAMPDPHHAVDERRRAATAHSRPRRSWPDWRGRTRRRPRGSTPATAPAASRLQRQISRMAMNSSTEVISIVATRRCHRPRRDCRICRSRWSARASRSSAAN